MNGMTAKTSGDLQFDVSGTVIRYLGDGEYKGRFDDGAEVVAVSEGGKEVGAGSQMGLCAIDGGWIMRAMQG